MCRPLHISRSLISRVGMVVLVGVLLWGASLATAQSRLDTFFLDTQKAEPFASTVPLEAGRRYRIAVDGTISPWTTNWNNGRYGAPEFGAMYPSPAGPDGWVGFDPVYAFSQPEPGDYPAKVRNLEIDFNGTWTPLAEFREFPYNPNHLYEFEVVGTDQPLRARFIDRPHRDNYGMFRFRVFSDIPIATPTPQPTPFPTNTPLIPGKAGFWINAVYEAERLNLAMHLVWSRPQPSPELDLILCVEVGGALYFFPDFGLTPQIALRVALLPGTDTGPFDVLSLPIPAPRTPFPMYWYAGFFENGALFQDLGIALSPVLIRK